MKQLDFGGSKNQKKTKKWNEIGQILVSGALDDTKTIGKVGGNIFAKSGPEKPPKNRKKIKIFSGIFPVFPVDFAKNPWIPVQTAGPHVGNY